MYALTKEEQLEVLGMYASQQTRAQPQADDLPPVIGTGATDALERARRFQVR